MDSETVRGVSRTADDATRGKSSRTACVNNGAVMMKMDEQHEHHVD